VGADQSKILIATTEAATLYNITANLTMMPVLQRGGGRVCFNSSTFGPIDCVAWGGYTGPTVINGLGGNVGPGTPIQQGTGLRRGQAMRRRLDTCMGATVLDFCDDTQVTSSDFVLGPPTPVNNAGQSGTVPPSTCGNGILESIEGCDDGDLTSGDGCNSSCSLEQGADVPRELAVDTAGNGVLDPGVEIAVVSPTWRNTVDATRNVDGDMISFTGPVGPTYNRSDLEAGYGMLADNAEAICGGARGCFGVNVPVPAVRPALHWDATMLESTTSLTTMPWSLHIGNSFVDVAVAANPFYRFVETLLHHGVTTGCGGNLYCPTQAVTREQMAVFLLVAKEGALYQPPACVTPPFADVPCASGFAKWIQELVLRGVTAGCGGGNYCPASPVTRDQMAVFLLVTLEGQGYVPPNCTASTFGDVPCDNSGGFSRWIYELVARGITAGCGGGNYCPTNPVTREQMAVFLSTTFGLALYSAP
jgi:cysteine-rich repeat protein